MVAEYLAIKKINPGVIAVIMTGYRQETAALVDIATKESAYSVLYKPFDMETLLKIVDEIWKKKRTTLLNRMCHERKKLHPCR